MMHNLVFSIAQLHVEIHAVFVQNVRDTWAHNLSKLWVDKQAKSVT